MTITRLVTLTKQIVTSPNFSHTPEQVAPIVEHIRQVSLELLGLESHPYNIKKKKKKVKSKTPRETPDTILYQHIFEDEHISVGIFILPKNAIIPLHDHPFMSVITLGLFGSCRLVSYDWKTTEARQTQEGEALLVQNKIMNPGDVVVCHPLSHGNIHSIQAVENFAMLDILIPPYGESRLCRYFDAHPDPPFPSAMSSTDQRNGNLSHHPSTNPTEQQQQQQFWLQAIPEPFMKLEHELYMGVQVDITLLHSFVPSELIPLQQCIDEKA